MKAPIWLRNLFKSKKPTLLPMVENNSLRKELTCKGLTKRTKHNKAQRNARKNNWRRH